MKRKLLSLKWELLAIILVCFVLPILVFAVGAVFLISESADQQSTQTVTYNFDYAVQVAQDNVQKVIDSSRAASYDPTVRNAYLKYQKNGDKVELYDSVQGFLSRLYTYDSNIPATTLFFMDEPEKIYYVTNGPRSSFTEMANMYRNYVHPMMLELSDQIGTGVHFVEYDGWLYMARNIVDSSYQPYAMIVMLLDPSSVFSSVTNMAWDEGCTVVVDGIVLALSGEKVQIPPGQTASVQTAYEKEDGTYTLYTRRDIDTHAFTYIAQVGNLPLRDQIPSFYYIFILAIVLTAILMVIFISFFYRRITRPMATLTTAAAQVQTGNLGYQIQSNYRNDEFAKLARSFNTMSARLEEMFEQNNKEQLALLDARIDALQSQINPHFLNNTLESIIWESRMEGATRVSAMIEALSTLLSGATARDGKTMVSIADEMVYLDSYLFIISARLGKRLSIKKEIDGTLLSQKVPRLIMQPLVENAVEHGVLPRQHGEIVLRVYRDGGNLILEVENDAPISLKRAAAIQKLLSGEGERQPDRGKLGISNVNERLKLIYGEESGLTIFSEDGKTVARIRIKLSD